ncbi:MAG: hydroxyacid dehydrogenase [Acidimicrobiia bacterium]|nr:hydroxyacid dehydrogenase [Acidimicrobiia bacterium]
MSTTVVVTDRVSEEGLEPLTSDPRFTVVRVDDSTSGEFWDAIASCEGLIVRSATNVDDEMLDRAPTLRAVGRAGVGVDNIDLPSATRRGVAVLNAPGGNTTAAAELTMALVLSMVRNVAAADRSIREGRWDRSSLVGSELKGKTLGLIGAGRIGGEVAMRCQAFGMDVVAYDPYLTESRAAELGIALVDLEDVISRADVVSIHVPLNDETRNLVDSRVLDRMKPSSFLVNASRGGVIDEEALAAALKGSHIAGAALDVFEHEPLPADSPLRSAPNLVMTPHLGASTAEAQVAVAAEVAEGMRLVLGSGDNSSAINADQLD